MSFRTIRDYRLVRIQVGDTLQRLALRELGDAGRWSELVYLNELRTPYIVPTAADAEITPNTLHFGAEIRIPATQRSRSAVSYEDLFGQDVDLGKGRLHIVNGDIRLVTGLANFRQAIQHRLVTEPGELLFHPRYGCQVRLVLGEGNNEVQQLLAAGFVGRALSNEPRIKTVSRIDVNSIGDVMDVDSTVIPVTENTPVDLNLVFPIAR